ncbi:MAG: hypothetical protein B6I34_06430 [Anaerolineaceae bacterium 4572_32.1]|nr:MAG: hypothetical protein B6I34_06430 [Anaerolineaceae bacterium 4572_32.1]
MNDLLTTRQLQELFQVDRITIYRMLNDGRLPGFKVGGQWRFSRQEIDGWLQEQREGLGIGDFPVKGDESGSSPCVLPLSCVQAIQSLYAEALEIAAVTTAPDGTPLTEISNSCEFCNLILSTEQGLRRCAVSWQLPEAGRSSALSLRACHAGMLCAIAPIVMEGELVANVIGCQFVAGNNAGAWSVDLYVLASELGLNEGDLQAAANSVRVLPDDQRPRVTRLLQKVADTLGEIAQERRNLAGRLERIAEMTNI